MLTLEKLKKMQPGIFDTGTSVDSPDGINMTNSELPLKWVAVRGGIHDWAIYVAHEDFHEDYVKNHGDKVHNRETVKKLVPCDDEALAMYRD